MMIFILLLISYLIGSIPSSIWVGKLFYQKDVRDFGSGNAGATNTFRVLGKKAGIPVLVFDIFKGFMASFILAKFSNLIIDNNQYIILQIGCGVFAVIGHVFPVFANFKGGKGVATALGMVIGLHPMGALICISGFLFIFVISNYISLASIISSILFPISIIFIFKVESMSLIIFSLIIPLLIIFTHKENIKRLLAGNENKMSFFKK